MKISKDDKVYIYSKQDSNILDGGNAYLSDYLGVTVLNINPVEYNKEYNGTSSDGTQFTVVINDKREIIANYIVDKNVQIENKKVSIGPYMSCVFSEDGKSFTLNGSQLFEIE